MTHSPTHDPADANADDFVQLNDLLDGRLDDADADALRARIETEPAMRDLWDELKRLQDCVRGYGPTGDALHPPADFVTQVRTRIEAAASPSRAVPDAASSSAASDATASEATASERGASAAARPRGRMLRMFTVAYAAAALVVVGFTVKYALDRPGDDARPLETADSPETSPDELATRLQKTDAKLESGSRSPPPEAGLADGLSTATRTLEREAAGRLADGRMEDGGARRDGGLDKSGAPPPPRGGFRGPGGFVPPSLREPRDPTPTPPTPSTGAVTAVGEGRRPVPTAPAPEPAPPPRPVPDPAPMETAEFDNEKDDEEDARRQPAKDASEPAPLHRLAGETLLVYESDDPVAARAEIDALLSQVRLARYSRDADLPPPLPGAGAAREPGDPTPPPSTPSTPPTSPGSAPAAPGSGAPQPPAPPSSMPTPAPAPARKAPRPALQPALRLFRLAEGDERAAGFLRRRESKRGPIGLGGGAGGAPDADAVAMRSVSRTLDAATYRRLSTLIGERTWSPRRPGEKPRRATESTRDAAGGKAKGSGAAGSGPARAKAANDPASKETPPADAPTGGPRARGKKASSAPPVRVRILIVPTR